MMSVLSFEEKNFQEEVLKAEGKVLVDFYADWCGPCRMMSPIVEEIAKELGETVKVGKVNVDNNQELAIQYDVMSIPTIIIFENGKILNTFVGVRDKNELLEALKEQK